MPIGSNYLYEVGERFVHGLQGEVLTKLQIANSKRVLTHVLTHTRISVSGHGSTKWTFALRNCLKSRPESAGKHRIARLFALTAAHNPEVVGLDLASATIKNTGWWL